MDFSSARWSRWAQKCASIRAERTNTIAKRRSPRPKTFFWGLKYPDAKQKNQRKPNQNCKYTRIACSNPAYDSLKHDCQLASGRSEPGCGVSTSDVLPTTLAQASRVTDEREDPSSASRTTFDGSPKYRLKESKRSKIRSKDQAIESMSTAKQGKTRSRHDSDHRHFSSSHFFCF